MNIKGIEKALKDYKRKRSIIETTLERIEVYNQALQDPEEYSGLFFGINREPGMPSGKGFKPTSIVEHVVITEEIEAEILQDWIKKDKSRIYPYQIEKEQIDAAMAALTIQERFIIECKYFENMFWNDIEINYNNKFSRPKSYITVAGIRKMNSEALYLLLDILEPYYERFKR